MRSKKLIVFLLFAFIPMIGVGLFLHSSGTPINDPGADPFAAVKGMLFSAGAMFIPLLAVVFTQLIFKEPVLRGVGISWRFNRWWWIGWILMPILAVATLGASLLVPGVHIDGDSEMMRAALEQLPAGFGPWGFIVISIMSGLFAGVTVNALFAFGEEVAWRGFLISLFGGKKFFGAAIIIGIIWGFWHAPLILNGHNYPYHPVAGVFMMVALCILLTVLLLYFRVKSGSVIVPAIMHGTLNAVAGICNIVLTPFNDLLAGCPGLAGMCVLLIVDICIFIYDRCFDGGKVFSSLI